MKRRNFESMPEPHFADYKSTQFRTPKEMPILLPEGILKQAVVRDRPVFREMSPFENDLTKNGQISGEPVGQRIIVQGRVMNEAGKGIPNALTEVWQANSAGRYIHKEEIHPAPIDPNFLGAGRAMTDETGFFRFVTIRPGPYPWGNHFNAWRPAHIHFSVWGQDFTQRLITQMFFEGDPTLKYDPIFNSVKDIQARNRMIGRFSIEESVPEWAQAYIFNIVIHSGQSA